MAVKLYLTGFFAVCYHPQSRVSRQSVVAAPTGWRMATTGLRRFPDVRIAAHRALW